MQIITYRSKMIENKLKSIKNRSKMIIIIIIMIIIIMMMMIIINSQQSSMINGHGAWSMESYTNHNNY